MLGANVLCISAMHACIVSEVEEDWGRPLLLQNPAIAAIHCCCKKNTFGIAAIAVVATVAAIADVPALVATVTETLPLSPPSLLLLPPSLLPSVVSLPSLPSVQALPQSPLFLPLLPCLQTITAVAAAFKKQLIW